MCITIFTILLIIAIYPYVLYPILGLILVFIKRIFVKKTPLLNTELPEITLLITAYNEEQFVEDKIKNTLQLEYPSDKLNVVWVTDGSTDNTPQIVKKYPQFKLMHSSERNGKVHAMQRAVVEVTTSIIVFCDANTQLENDSLIHIANQFSDNSVGAVSGEKRVCSDLKDTAAPAGEGLYWKYESLIKQIDSNLYTAVGAAGELFAIRKELYEPVPNDTILDDFLITLKIAGKGYRIAYEPKAAASEYGSANVTEEMKRKIRIAAGSFQVLSRNPWLFNVFKNPILVFQFISHKFMRWIVTPLLMVLLLPMNIVLLWYNSHNLFLWIVLILQILFYLLSYTGYLIQGKSIRNKVLFVPYYFFMANLAQFKGLLRFFKGNTSVKWDRSERIIKS